jgi:hypothetical protein
VGNLEKGSTFALSLACVPVAESLRRQRYPAVVVVLLKLLISAPSRYHR